MSERDEPRDTSVPANTPGNKEQAEGSRENVNVETPISNRPIEEEQRAQQNLPPRGRSKEEEGA